MQREGREILALKWQLKTGAVANFENIYAMWKWRGERQPNCIQMPRLIREHAILFGAPSISIKSRESTKHRQSPLGITKFLSNSLYSSQGVLRCPGQSKRRANILPLSFWGTISLSRSPVGITILDANTIIQMWEATFGNCRGVLTIHAHLAMLSTKIYIHI